jgi:hypothetical protein
VLFNSTAIDKILGKKYACFGDSITSDQVTGIGTVINSELGTSLIGNFATGWATCSDWHDGETNISPITLAVPPNTDTSDNVLSNQIRRLLQHMAASGSQITWRHPLDGDFSLPASVGLGLGHTDDIPDIIYIAIGTNDGKNDSVPIFDDTDRVFEQSYAQLSRNSMASALRWAIETLLCVYPNAQIFVASPLQTYTPEGSNPWMSYANGLIKRSIIKKVCRFCSVYFIDSFSESGFSRMVAYHNGEVHPNEVWKSHIAKYVANNIRLKYVARD